MTTFSGYALFLTLLISPKGNGCLPLQKTPGKPSWIPNEPPEERGVEGAFESDIRIKKEHKLLNILPESRVKRNAVSRRATLWPDAVVSYRFSDGYSTLQTPDSVTGVILFSLDRGCSSEVGRPEDVSETTLGYSCSTVGSIMHEIGHIIGYYHEQSRPDRDNHVTINVGNIQSGKEIDFKKYDANTARTDQPYDISSVMHYGPTWFSKDGHSPTMVPKTNDLLRWMGQRDGLSFIDVKSANQLYNCHKNCASNVACENDGYVGPNCNCVCPPGLSGRHCAEVARGTLGCGGVLTGDMGIITSPNYPNKYGNNVECNWLIQGERRGNIELHFTKFDVEGDRDKPCPYDFLEVRTMGSSLSGRTGFSRQDGNHQHGVQPEGDYDFSHPYRGLAIVISQENFTVPGNEQRPYAQTEIMNMREAFTQLGFHVVCFTDLTCTQMMDVLKRAAALDIHSYSDCFACVIGSHGNEIPASKLVDKKEKQQPVDKEENVVFHDQVVYGADGPIELKKVVDLFSDQQCPKLSKKPKMFFIQACRSRMGVPKEKTLDKGGTVETQANKPQSSDQSDTNEGKGIFNTIKSLFKPWQQMALIDPVCPVCPKDSLIMYSTPTEHYAFAKEKDGGWMLRCLYLGLTRTSGILGNGTLDLLTLLTMVVKLGAQCFEVNNPGQPEHGSKSAFVVEHKLTDDIFFKRK